MLKQTENSQCSTNISGIRLNPNGKRDLFLAQTGEPKEESIDFHITPKKVRHKNLLIKL